MRVLATEQNPRGECSPGRMVVSLLKIQHWGSQYPRSGLRMCRTTSAWVSSPRRRSVSLFPTLCSCSHPVVCKLVGPGLDLLSRPQFSMMIPEVESLFTEHKFETAILVGIEVRLVTLHLGPVRPIHLVTLLVTHIRSRTSACCKPPSPSSAPVSGCTSWPTRCRHVTGRRFL
jgi:hypothetical protein